MALPIDGRWLRGLAALIGERLRQRDRAMDSIVGGMQNVETAATIVGYLSGAGILVQAGKTGGEVAIAQLVGGTLVFMAADQAVAAGMKAAGASHQAVNSVRLASLAIGYILYRRSLKRAAGEPELQSATPRNAESSDPTEPYNRAKHYGKTPTQADRKAIGAGKGEVADHDPPLVKRYYEGDPAAAEKPGYQMTDAERLASAADRARMRVQPQGESNQQGGQMAQYSKQKKKDSGLK